MTGKIHLYLAHQHPSYRNVQELGSASETVEGVCDESLAGRHLHNAPRLCQLLSLPVEKQAENKAPGSFLIVCRRHTHASLMVRGEQALNYSNLLAHKSLASQNKIRPQSSLSDLCLAEVGQQGPPHLLTWINTSTLCCCSFKLVEKTLYFLQPESICISKIFTEQPHKVELEGIGGNTLS